VSAKAAASMGRGKSFEETKTLPHDRQDWYDWWWLSQHFWQERQMALLRRELYRQVKGPEITHADCCTLVFDTDAKNLYVEREVAQLDTTVEGAIEIRTATMDIADYLKQGGQTAGHRELWRLLRTLFKEDRNSDELVW
jgi:hypothetical protein